MSHELAKQLIDAGFPTKPYPEWALKMDGPMGEVEHRENYRPTLSELIEACGKDFYALWYSQESEWRAARTDDTPNFSAGSTPEEAVAKLWLALNKK